MRYEIDGSPRRMRECSKETLSVPEVSIAERVGHGHGRREHGHAGSTPGKRPKNRDGPAKARGGWPKIIDFPIRGPAQNLGGLSKHSIHLISISVPRLILPGIIPIGTNPT